MLQRNQKISGWTEHGQGRRCIGRKCLGQAVRPNDPQRKSDTDTRVDPKTSPVPRLEGNPPAVRRAFLFYGKKARRAVGFNGDCHPWQSTNHPQPTTPSPRSTRRPNLAQRSVNFPLSPNRARAPAQRETGLKNART